MGILVNMSLNSILSPQIPFNFEKNEIEFSLKNKMSVHTYPFYSFIFKLLNK